MPSRQSNTFPHDQLCRHTLHAFFVIILFSSSISNTINGKPSLAETGSVSSYPNAPTKIKNDPIKSDPNFTQNDRENTFDYDEFYALTDYPSNDYGDDKSWKEKGEIEFVRNGDEEESSLPEKRRLRFVKKRFEDNTPDKVDIYLPEKRRLRFVKKNENDFDKRRLRFVKKSDDVDDYNTPNKRRLRFIKRRLFLGDQGNSLLSGGNVFYRENNQHKIQRRSLPIATPLYGNLDSIDLEEAPSKRNIGIARAQRLLYSMVAEDKERKLLNRMLAAGKKRSQELEVRPTIDNVILSVLQDFLQDEDNSMPATAVEKRHEIGIARIQRLLFSLVAEQREQELMKKLLAAGKKRSQDSGMGKTNNDVILSALGNVPQDEDSSSLPAALEKRHNIGIARIPRLLYSLIAEHEDEELRKKMLAAGKKRSQETKINS